MISRPTEEIVIRREWLRRILRRKVRYQTGLSANEQAWLAGRRFVWIDRLRLTCKLLLAEMDKDATFAGEYPQKEAVL
jgi:hypothetical protein